MCQADVVGVSAPRLEQDESATPTRVAHRPRAPEHHVSLALLRRVGETLPLLPRDVVTDQVQRNDRHPGRLREPGQPTDVVDQPQPLTNPRQRRRTQPTTDQQESVTS